MKLVKVQSSNIQAVGYENNNLVIKYNSGAYVYENVPQALYESLVQAESKGRFVNTNIKGYFNYFKSSEKYEVSED